MADTSPDPSPSPVEPWADKLAAHLEKLAGAVEFDVNGVAGKGGNGGLTSDDTLRLSGEAMRLVDRWRKSREGA